LEADSSGLWIGIGKEIAAKLEELKNEEAEKKIHPQTDQD
jgi:hypothetical protein